MTAALISVGGLILVAVTGSYLRTAQRLTAIETALGIHDTADAREGRQLQVQAQARRVCEGPHECYYDETSSPGTNPRLRHDPGAKPR